MFSFSVFFPAHKSLLIRGLFLKERVAPKGSQQFPFKVDLFRREAKTVFTWLPLLNMYQFPLSIFEISSLVGELNLNMRKCPSAKALLTPVLLTGDQEVAGSIPAEVCNILSWRLIMKYFLRSFSLPLIQEGQLSVSGERMCTTLANRLED